MSRLGPQGRVTDSKKKHLPSANSWPDAWTWTGKLKKETMDTSEQEALVCAKDVAMHEKRHAQAQRAIESDDWHWPSRTGAVSHWPKVVGPRATQWSRWFVPGRSRHRADLRTRGLSEWSFQVLQVSPGRKDMRMRPTGNFKLDVRVTTFGFSMRDGLPTGPSPIWGIPGCRRSGYRNGRMDRRRLPLH